jgi:hypothetical protein
MQHSNLIMNTGYINFITQNNQKVNSPLISRNSLWYYQSENATDFLPGEYMVQRTPIINHLTYNGQYELIQAQFGHPGTTAMSALQQHMDNIPKLCPHSVYKCPACLHMKLVRWASKVKQVQETLSTPPTDTKQISTLHTRPNNDTTCKPGECFHMDMGFVCGTKFTIRDTDGNLVTILDRFNSHILMHWATRYIWVFLMKNKVPKLVAA